MTEKELRKLSRADLLNMLIDQSEELEGIRKQLRIAQEALQNRTIAIDTAGSIAEAALKLNGIFEAAQASCQQYVENIYALGERQAEISQQRERESVKAAEERLAEAKKRCAMMEAQTQTRCRAMLDQARAEAQAYIEKASRRIIRLCEKYPEIQEVLSAPLNVDE